MSFTDTGKTRKKCSEEKIKISIKYIIFEILISMHLHM